MAFDILLLLAALFIILVAAELFTNGIEWLGQRLSLSEGVVGSVLAAVGTALPETLIPVVSILFFGNRHGDEVGIGAIAGAPFMLSTLTMALMGISVWLYSQKGRRSHEIGINKVVISRDMRFFIVAYSIALLASLASDYQFVRNIMAIAMVGIYLFYLYQTLRHEGETGEQPEQLHLDRIFNSGSNRLIFIVPQVLLGVAGILAGAYLFVDKVEDLSQVLGVPAFILSLIIAPIATELPEKVNSFIWARSGKDTFAMGNITGAMVFQSCFPVAFGMSFTKWALTPGAIITGIVAISMTSFYLFLIQKSKLKAHHLMFGAFAYAVTVSLLITFGLHPHAGH
jgi:cation:H+ antiporter